MKVWQKIPQATRTEIKRDVVVFLGALLSTGILDNFSQAALVAAIVTALKVTARSVFPHGDPEPAPAPAPVDPVVDEADTGGGV